MIINKQLNPLNSGYPSSISLLLTKNSTGNNTISMECLLSKRELECLEFLAHGKRTKEIALQLGLSPRTVESYVNAMKMKTKCFSTSKLIDIYWRELEKKELSVFYYLLFLILNHTNSNNFLSIQ